MGFLAPALPWIAKGGAALGAHFLGKKATSSAMKRSPEEQVAVQGGQKAAGALQQTGSELVGEGRQTLQQPTNYWQRLLGGNRPLMAQATAGARGGITDIYRGAERGLEKSGVRGAQRDVAKAELGRQKASQIAGLTTGVQPFAAQQLMGIGSEQLGTGAPMLGQAGDIYTNMLSQGAQNRQYARGEGEKAGAGIGGFLFDMISGIGGKKRGGGGGGPSPVGAGPWYEG